MPENSGDSYRYLIVDDDVNLTQVLSRALERRGSIVFTANNTEQALAVCQQENLQRCILDLKIGHQSGLPLVPQLLSINPLLSIVMLTGYSSIQTAVEAIKLGAENYLCKPAGPADILKAFDASQEGELPAPAEHPPSVNRLEWEHIQKVLAENDGNISATARSLGMHRRTLQRKLQKKPSAR